MSKADGLDTCRFCYKPILPTQRSEAVVLSAGLMHGACHRRHVEKVNRFLAEEVARGAAPAHLLPPGVAIPAATPYVITARPRRHGRDAS